MNVLEPCARVRGANAPTRCHARIRPSDEGQNSAEAPLRMILTIDSTSVSIYQKKGGSITKYSRRERVLGWYAGAVIPDDVQHT